MRIILISVFMLPLMLLGERPQYRILARLDPQGHRVAGEMTLTWTNPSSQTLDFIPFHLYMNAFSSPDTIFMKESRGVHRGYTPAEGSDHSGFCRVLSVRGDGAPIPGGLTPLTELEDPQAFRVWDPSELLMAQTPDDTIAILKLPRPLPPGETIRIELAFETKLPPVFARTGYWSTFHMVAQWFPKPGVWEEGRGWNVHFFHANSEFFADFSDFLVTVELSSAFVVGATGILRGREERDGLSRHTFRAERVHDFAFTAWDHWQVAEDRWREVHLTLLYPPGNQATVPRQFHALKTAMETCAELCGLPYPYPCFTLLDIPSQALGAAGMEYPMLVTASMLSPAMPQAIGIPDSTIMHEFIHNYFYGLLATNEFEHPWMDEGMTSYATVLAMERAGLQGLDLGPLSLDPIASEQLGFWLYRGPAWPALPAWAFHAGGYGSMTYNRPALFLKTLENLVGRPAINRLFATYMARCAYTHPAPETFFSIVDEVLGPQARRFLEEGIRTRKQLDQAVFSLHSRPAKSQTPSGPGGYETTVVVGNLGEMVLPLTLACILEDGTSKTFHWEGTSGPTHVIHLKTTLPVVTARIDPLNHLVCDRTRANNAITRQPSPQKPASRLAAALTLTVQAFLSQVSLWL